VDILNKVLLILHTEEQDYDPSIQLEVVDLDDEKVSKRDLKDYYVCKTSKEFSDVLIELSDDFERYFDTEIKLCDLKEISNTRFGILIENYEYLQLLKSLAYDLTNAKNNFVEKYREHIYKEEGGYGTFRQEIIIFDNLRNIVRKGVDFKEFINKNLNKFQVLLPSSEKQARINLLKNEIEVISQVLESAKRDIKSANERILRSEARRHYVLEELALLNKDI
jgi:hypothetical protein